MNVTFKRLTIHHFLSMGDCEVDLGNRGYCLVSGINNNPKDAAKSNGSGKSTIWSALSYVLTGKTTQGITSSLPNNFFGDGCWVSLSFDVDGDEYILTRSKDDKDLGTNLKIVINGQNKSGKGIQESSKILSDLLPDLNEELIGSIIILGQGMPNKFTRNTPAKRKEILEHLSKSDFMIDDLKRRISDRIESLSKSMRDVEDGILRDGTLKESFNHQLLNSRSELDTLIREVGESNLDGRIKDSEDKIKALEESLSKLNEEAKSLNESVEASNKTILDKTMQKQTRLDKIRADHEKYSQEDNAKKTKLMGDIYILNQEISKLKSISDICPTCGQRIPNVVKPDTRGKESQLEELNMQLDSVNISIAYDNKEYQETMMEIDEAFNKEVQSLNHSLLEAKENLRKANQGLYNANSNKMALAQSIASLRAQKDNYDSNKARMESNIQELASKIEGLEKELESLALRGSNIKLHQDVVNKMSTYVKRDFRGFLLSGIIDYIQSKAKEYCSKIFNTDEIGFSLDGNNIDISFCGKPFELLSGGEQQRADLIIQFAIRDMMCQYLDFGCNILVLDEITDNLDSISCDRVLGFISNELKDIESIFIISHHSNELGICNDGEIVVMKDSNGVSEITSQY